MPGVMDLQKSGDACAPLAQCCPAHDGIEWLLNAALRVLADGHGVGLDNVLEGLAAQDGVEVILHLR